RRRRRLALPRDARRALPDDVQVPPVVFAVRARRRPPEGAPTRHAARGLALAPLQSLEPRRVRSGHVMLSLILGSPLTPLEHAARHVLNWLHFSVGLPWAWSIVALTVIVRMLLVPLTVKQIHSMQNLQR